MIVSKKLLAISINICNRGWMMAWTSGLAAAVSGETPRGRSAGVLPSWSSCYIICSYTYGTPKTSQLTRTTSRNPFDRLTFKGLISKFRSLCSIKLLIFSDNVPLR